MTNVAAKPWCIIFLLECLNFCFLSKINSKWEPIKFWITYRNSCGNAFLWRWRHRYILSFLRWLLLNLNLLLLKHLLHWKILLSCSGLILDKELLLHLKIELNHFRRNLSKLLKLTHRNLRSSKHRCLRHWFLNHFEWLLRRAGCCCGSIWDLVLAEDLVLRLLWHSDKVEYKIEFVV